MKKRFLLRLRKASGLVICLLLMLANYSEPVLTLRDMPGDIHIRSGEAFNIPSSGIFSSSFESEAIEASYISGDSLLSLEDSVITLNLFGIIPVKSVNVHVREEVVLVPGGSSIGVTLQTKGALVVGVSSVINESGQSVSPASAAGINAGDLIEKVNNEEVKNAEHLAYICNTSESDVSLTIIRDGERFTTTVKPAIDGSDGKRRMGMWVRDSTAGVGTLSFYEPSSNWYGALGHAITDVDTRASLTVREGEIVVSDIVDIIQGTQGEPGELRGTFSSSSKALGTIEVNGQYGIFGCMYDGYENPLYKDGVNMAYPEEAHLGEAQILTTLDSGGIKAYDCNIIKANPQSDPAQKGMIIEITDGELLSATGGIVQGMSGSPLMQDGKLIGVVTHVFINDPAKGYCMYAYWMQQQILSNRND